MTEPEQFMVDGLRGKLFRDVDMRRHTSWRAGGRAERMYRPAGLDDLAAYLRAVPAEEPLLAVGLGSNLLVRDGGLRGTVLLLHAALDELRIEADGSVYAQAGVPGAKLARFAALHDLAGAEFFAGIPGTVGGMLAMNAGCHGSETWGKVLRVQVMTRDGRLLERTPDEYEIGYRQVALKFPRACGASPLLQRGGDEWFAAAWFRFAPGDGAASREKVKALLGKRIATQPLDLPNAGSVFRNPPGEYAARLIEQCGLKGLQIGGARVSGKHANFIVNTGNATAEDIENLIDEVQAAVEAKTGIRLHPEVKIVGEVK